MIFVQFERFFFSDQITRFQFHTVNQVSTNSNTIWVERIKESRFIELVNYGPKPKIILNSISMKDWKGDDRVKILADQFWFYAKSQTIESKQRYIRLVRYCAAQSQNFSVKILTDVICTVQSIRRSFFCALSPKESSLFFSLGFLLATKVLSFRGRKKQIEKEMFQLPRRPDKETAYKQLRSHLTIMGSCIAVIRVTPYILHFLTKEKEELKLELWLRLFRYFPVLFYYY